MTASVSRRRFLALAATFAGTPAIAGTDTPVATWQGTALGANASMQLAGVSQADAAAIFADVTAEISRLENIFSLYRPASAVSQLNQSGKLNAPPPELLEVLSLAGSVHRATDGAFNPCVQPLWALYSETSGYPGRAPIRNALTLTDWRNLQISTSRLAFAKTGMALTLNGIAQGYITDQVADLLRAREFVNILVNMGEIAAFGTGPDGREWKAGIALPDGRLLGDLALQNRALATSAPSGTTFDRDGKVGHILNARTGSAKANYHLASVSAPKAAVADALSTAFCTMSADEISLVPPEFPGVRIEMLT